MLTNMQHMSLIRSGREAIERAMLNVVLRAVSGTNSYKQELNELSSLLGTYNQLMARHQRFIFDVQAANDKTSNQEK